MSKDYEVMGYDKEGRKVFHLLVEAPNKTVAKLYAAAHLQRTPDGAEAVMSAVKTEAKKHEISETLRDRLAAIRENW